MGGGPRPLWSDTEGGEIGLAPSFFLVNNTHLATRNPKFLTEIEPDCGEYFFFGLHLNLGTKFRTEIELLSFTPLRKNISPPRNLLNQQKIDAYLFYDSRTMMNTLLVGADLMDLLVGVEHDTTVVTSLAAKIVTSAQAVMVAPMKNPRRRWVESIWFHRVSACAGEHRSSPGGCRLVFCSTLVVKV